MRRIVNKRENKSFSFIWIGAFAAVLYLAVSGQIDFSNVKATRSAPLVDSRAAFMLDMGSGAVLYAKNSDAALPPASMSKMMTELIVLDAVNEGQLSWGDKVTASKYAADVIGSQIGFSEGERFTVRELFEAMTVSSANDAAVALAEFTAGSEKKFVELMNKKAAAIGLSEATVFGNATGLAVNDLRGHKEAAAEHETLMSARDTAMLAAYLLGKYPEVIEVTSRSSVKLASNGQQMASTNLMLSGMPFSYSGNDGLKTGYTTGAGYCFTGTAKRDGKRLITVVMGAETPEMRFAETEFLLNYGFRS